MIKAYLYSELLEEYMPDKMESKIKVYNFFFDLGKVSAQATTIMQDPDAVSQLADLGIRYDDLINLITACRIIHSGLRDKSSE